MARGHLWSIVLAGGDGVRARAFIRQWLGSASPKQYCAFVGTRSMFQHTLDRAALLTPWERIVVVAARHHQPEVWHQLHRRPAGLVLLQPENRDTAAGVFLPLTYILARDPGASVVVYPSDHFIYPEDRFVSAVDHAVRGSNLLGGRPVLLAARPDFPELEYGWIHPGRFLGWTGDAPVLAVDSFIEKPEAAAARLAKDRGGLWNTMVLAAGGKQLWDLGLDCVPEVMALFDRLRRAIDTTDEPKVLSAIYDTMPRRSFSSHLLQRRPDRLGVMEMREVLWSDWGNPARITETLDRIGKQPAFAEETRELLPTG